LCLWLNCIEEKFDHLYEDKFNNDFNVVSYFTLYDNKLNNKLLMFLKIIYLEIDKSISNDKRKSYVSRRIRRNGLNYRNEIQGLINYLNLLSNKQTGIFNLSNLIKISSISHKQNDQQYVNQNTFENYYFRDFLLKQSMSNAKIIESNKYILLKRHFIPAIVKQFKLIKQYYLD